MTDEQRAEAHRQYRRFADEIGTRHAPGGDSASTDWTGAVRVPVEELDTVVAADRLVFTQVRTKKQITVRGEIARRLQPHLGGHPFTLAELNGGADGRNAHEVARTLREAGILRISFLSGSER